MIAYRDATLADAEAIDALFRASFVATFGHLYRPADLAVFLAQFTAQAWRDELGDEGYDFRLAEQDGVLVGFAKMSAITLPVEPLRPARELRQLYLADAAKGTGAADALIAWATERARARGAGEVILSVYVDNHRARRFYERHGFVEIGRYAFMVGDHEDDDRIMRLKL